MNQRDELLAYLLEREGFERQSEYTIPRRDNDDAPPPLSFAQERFWFLDQFEHARPVYNGCKVERLVGELRLEVLLECLNLIVRRHEVLRTSYPAPDGRPIQRIAPSYSIEITVTDLEHVADAELPCAIELLIRNEWLQPIDLSEGLPIRARLARIDHAQHLLVLTLHQIVFDSQSVAIFFRELWTAYEAILNGREPQLAALPVQYADFASWQRHRVSGQTFQSHREYWVQRLSGTLPVLNFPTDKPRPPVQGFDGSRLSILLPETLQLKLKELSRENGVTLFVTLLAAFKTLLYRYTAQEDLLVGCPVLNRRLPEIENLLGSFVNTLVLRTDYSGSPTFRETLRRVRETCVGAFAHQDFPFEKLVEELQPQRDLARNPIFQVMFAFQNTSVPALELAGLRSEAVDIDGGMTKFDLTFSLIDKEHGIAGHIEYSTDLFNRDTIERMARHFQTLLEGIAVDPDQSIATLPIMTEPERHQILFEWNDTVADYSKDKCIHELFEEQVERTPDAIALEYQDKRITYRELNRKANQLAHYLISLGIGPEKLVGICVERSIEMVVGLMGILKASGAYVPLDPSYPKERLRFMLEDSQVSVLLTQAKLVEDRGWKPVLSPSAALRINSVEGMEDGDPRSSIFDLRLKVVYLDQDLPMIEQQSSQNPTTPIDSHNLAYVIYTSGSTGQPKGVQIEHRSVVNCLSSIGRAIDLSPQDAWLAVTTISFDIAALELYLPLIRGAKLTLAGKVESSDSGQLLARMKASRTTIVQATPSLWKMLLENDLKNKPNFKILCGGEALSRQLADQLLGRGSVWNLYGPTESTIWSTMAKVAADDKPIPIGRPIANTQIYIRDNYLQPVPIGIPGDLYIGGDGLARGYLNRLELTPEKFIPNPFSDNSNSGLYRTGDRAKYLADGNIEFLGRIDNQVKVRGHRVELGEIEAALNQHPAVKDSVVVGRDIGRDADSGSKEPNSKIEDLKSEMSLVAYIVPTQSKSPLDDLCDFLREKLPEFMIPSIFVSLKALPHTPNGKMDRRSLPPPGGLRPDMTQEFVLTRTPTEELLAGIWSEVLRLDSVGVHDNFFDLGGHSLVAARVIARIRKIFAIELPLRAIFETPTVAGLARAVEASLQSGQKMAGPLITRRLDETPILPSSAQEPLLHLGRVFPGISLFNIPAVYRLKGPVNVTALRQSIASVVDRHEALRTSFPIVNGQHVQRISSPPQPIEFDLLNLGALPPEDREAGVWMTVREEADQPFDLDHGSLYRVRLLRLDNEEHILLIVLHHVISDGSSMAVFCRDLAAFYEAFSSGCPCSLPALPIQYADFTQWQRQAIKDGLLDGQIAYWKQQLAGFLPILELCPGRPIADELTFFTGHRSLAIKGDLFTAIKNLSQTEQSTVFVILLTALKILLYGYTRERDIRIGTLVENRSRSETENLIGHFANTLIIRTGISADLSFDEFAQQVRDITLAGYAHQELPFEALIQALEREQKLNRADLCQVMLIYQNVPMHLFTMPGLSIEALHDLRSTKGLDFTPTTFDLVFLIKERPGELMGSVIYKVGKFEEAEIDLIIEHFLEILGRIVAQPRLLVSQICSIPDRRV